jgi:glutamate/aspartate transport system substrate-binding protein
MAKRKLEGRLATLLLIAALWLPAMGHTAAPVLRIGVQASSIPFAFEGQIDGDYHGYSVDICEKVLAHLNQQRAPGEAPLTAEYVQITSKTRIAMLLAGEIDMECGSTSNTASRRALGVTFSPTIFVSDVAVLMSPALASESRSLADWVEALRREPTTALITTAGSTSVRHLKNIEQLVGKRLSPRYGSNHEDSFHQLRGGHAQAFVMDRVLLSSRLAMDDSLAHDGFSVSPWGLAQDEPECYGLMTRDSAFGIDPALNQAVEHTVRSLMRDDGLRGLHRKWFEQPIEPAKRPREMKSERALGGSMSILLRMQMSNPSVSVCERAAR